MWDRCPPAQLMPASSLGKSTLVVAKGNSGLSAKEESSDGEALPNCCAGKRWLRRPQDFTGGVSDFSEMRYGRRPTDGEAVLANPLWLNGTGIKVSQATAGRNVLASDAWLPERDVTVEPCADTLDCSGGVRSSLTTTDGGERGGVVVEPLGSHDRHAGDVASAGCLVDTRSTRGAVSCVLSATSAGQCLRHLAAVVAMAEAAARLGDAVARRGSETLPLTARSAVTAAAAAGSPGPVATSSRLLNPACVLGENRKSKLAGTFRVAGRREAYQNQLGEEGSGHVSCDRHPVRLVSSPSCCLVSGLDDASRSEGVQVPTSCSGVERVNERALISSDRELLFSSSA